MITHNTDYLKAAIFITFSGNCKKALSFYQTCFGGELHFETLDQALPGFTETPVVSGSLVADRIIIHGSDLVHNEGRRVGNYLSIFLQCTNAADRLLLKKKLERNNKKSTDRVEKATLIEVTDAFDVRWMLGV